MRPITKEMIKLYNIDKLCFMGYEATKDNPYTFHHCVVKRCSGGTESIKNGAVLTLNAHEYLNTIEMRDYEIYLYLNILFQKINEQGNKPNLQQYRTINHLLKLFEEQHKNEKFKSGKNVLKPIYTQRKIYDL